jgi:hypothetical protein
MLVCFADLCAFSRSCAGFGSGGFCHVSVSEQFRLPTYRTLYFVSIYVLISCAHALSLASFFFCIEMHMIVLGGLHHNQAFESHIFKLCLFYVVQVTGDTVKKNALAAIKKRLCDISGVLTELGPLPYGVSEWAPLCL